MIRKALEKDIDRINELLYQVQKVHSDKRPDIFQDGKKKYNSEQIAEIIKDENTPVFVAVDDNDTVLGYAFCIFEIIKNHPSLATRKTLYIDDLCVDENIRGQKIGTKLYEYVLQFAKENGCNNITLNVWCLNKPAMKFYEKCGLTPLKVTMEQKL